MLFTGLYGDVAAAEVEESVDLGTFAGMCVSNVWLSHGVP